jgi:uncharacterized protein YdgA (DUF945 family)
MSHFDELMANGLFTDVDPNSSGPALVAAANMLLDWHEIDLDSKNNALGRNNMDLNARANVHNRTEFLTGFFELVSREDIYI